MKLKKTFAALLCLLVLCGCGASPAAPAATEAPAAPAESAPAQTSGEATAAPERIWPLTVTDDLGRAVTLEAPPAHVSALVGSFAETWLLAGGALSSTVRDAWDDFDLELGPEVTNLGNYKEVSLEKLFETEADLVLASGNTKSHVELKDTLEQAKVPVLYFEVNSFDDYLRMLKVTSRAGRICMSKTGWRCKSRSTPRSPRRSRRRRRRARRACFCCARPPPASTPRAARERCWA